MDSNENDGAISPVIGTVLMVAITVILAAVIGTFVFGVPQNIQKAKFMGSAIQLDTNGGTVLMSYHGGPDDVSLSYITITAPNGTVWYTSSAEGDLTLSSASSPPPVKPGLGAVMKLSPAPDWPTGKRRILAVGQFNDGVQQIIMDTNV
jgi:archaeal type IV pilus assembly protein PilA